MIMIKYINILTWDSSAVFVYTIIIDSSKIKYHSRNNDCTMLYSCWIKQKKEAILHLIPIS